ncbi:hypothetical protein GLYMA_15G085750v4 [Glycine max]|nr:hypothetical protein GLYMA_15G085750v4 [Glycine max]KAH1146250.1 hypothetical protein GYH30_041763 [Glycine max]
MFLSQAFHATLVIWLLLKLDAIQSKGEIVIMVSYTRWCKLE